MSWEWPEPIRSEVERARKLHPSGDLLTTAFAEEAGEVIKAILDHYEGKGSLLEVLSELVQVIAMAVRLMEEGDPIHRLPPLAVSFSTRPNKGHNPEF